MRNPHCLGNYTGILASSSAARLPPIDDGAQVGQTWIIRGIRHPHWFGGTLGFVCAGVLALSGCAGALSPLADEGLPPTDASLDKERITVPLAPAQVRVEVRVTALAPHTLQIPVASGSWSAPRGRLHESLIELEFELAGATSAPQKIADIAKQHFLHTEQFPRGRLEGRWLRPRAGAEPPSYELFFDLLLKNRRRHLRAPAALVRVGCDVRMTTVFQVDRREFGIADSGNYERMVGKHIEVRVEVSTPTAPFGISCPHPSPLRGADLPQSRARFAARGRGR